MSLIQSLVDLDLAQLSESERWILLGVAERAVAYVVEHRDALSSPQKARALVHSQLARLESEVFLVVFLDSQNCVVGCEKMFQGTIDSCAVHPREVVKKALALNAAAVIVAHNHPSGSPEPSAADRNITKKLKDALALIDMRLLDHLIVGHGRKENITSLAEMGLV